MRQVLRGVTVSGRVKKIKIKLIELEKTQAEIAKELGISRFHFNNIIAGRSKNSKIEKWIKENLEEVA